MLKQAIRRYQNRAIEAAQAIEELAFTPFQSLARPLNALVKHFQAALPLALVCSLIERNTTENRLLVFSML